MRPRARAFDARGTVLFFGSHLSLHVTGEFMVRLPLTAVQLVGTEMAEGGRPARRRACAISDFGLIQLNKLGTSIDSGTIYKIGLKIKQNGPLLRPG